jgi:hypothetical protein
VPTYAYKHTTEKYGKAVGVVISLLSFITWPISTLPYFTLKGGRINKGLDNRAKQEEKQRLLDSASPEANSIAAWEFNQLNINKIKIQGETKAGAIKPGSRFAKLHEILNNQEQTAEGKLSDIRVSVYNQIFEVATRSGQYKATRFIRTLYKGVEMGILPKPDTDWPDDLEGFQNVAAEMQQNVAQP